MGAISIVLFDLGSTLIYFDGHWPDVLLKANRALLQAVENGGIEIDGPDFIADFRERLDAYHIQREAEFVEYTTAYVLTETLAAWGHPEVDQEIVQPALEAMYAVSQSHWKAEKDAVPTLNRLRRQGYRLGLISNAGDDLDVQALVDQAGLRPFFEVVLSSAGVGIRKPNPRIFQMALARWNADPAEAVMVGDTLGADVLGAHNAGILSVWITRRADTPANRAHAGTIRPDIIVETLEELPQKIQAINGAYSGRRSSP